MIGEMTSKSSNLPKNYNYNHFFLANVKWKSESKIPNDSTPFEYFLNKSDFL